MKKVSVILSLGFGTLACSIISRRPFLEITHFAQCAAKIDTKAPREAEKKRKKIVVYHLYG